MDYNKDIFLITCSMTSDNSNDSQNEHPARSQAEQHVNFSTHVHGHLLDLLITWIKHRYRSFSLQASVPPVLQNVLTDVHMVIHTHGVYTSIPHVNIVLNLM